MKTSVSLFIGASAIILLWVAVFSFTSRQSLRTELDDIKQKLAEIQIESTEQEEDIIQEEIVIEEPEISVEEQEALEYLEKFGPPESFASKPLQYFPPPSINLTGPKLGTQRVPGTKDIGDVYQLYFHQPSYTLFMAVIEDSGLRAIWRLNQEGEAERVFASNTQKGEIRIFGDSTGVIYVQHNNPSRMYRTDDLFASWQMVLKDFGMFWAMADNGKGTLYGTLHDFNRAILYRSTDNGMNWESWKDFQELFPEDAVQYAEDDERFRMRHLHDIIYSEKSDAIIVGTGDVARYALESRDGGETWKKIWDEGFTAHSVVSGGNRYLLGPDKLRGPGIVLYDAWEETVQEVWNPADHGYAGYVYSMANVNGINYAAIHTEANEVEDIVPVFGIIVSPDAETWYPFLEWGPLGNHARTDIWIEEAPATIYASVNGALYAFRPVDEEWFEGKKPFSK